MRLQQSTVKERLAAWMVRYPSPKRNAGQIQFLTEEYCDDLEGEFSDELFQVAAKIVQKKVKFFPSVADIFDAKEEAQQIHNRMSEAKPGNHLRLTEDAGDNTPEKIALDQQRMAIIWEAIGKGTPEAFDAANRKLESLVGYAQE